MGFGLIDIGYASDAILSWKNGLGIVDKSTRSARRACNP